MTLPDGSSWHKQVYGLTGSIGSGKSTASGLFRELGAYVICADTLARKAVEPGTSGLGAVVERFGKDMLLEDGALDRARIAQIVFPVPEERKALEAIIHPEVERLAEAEFIDAVASNPPLIIYDVPLLFETGHVDYKGIIVVATSENVLLERAAKRDASSVELVKSRYAQQLPIAEKIARATYVIDNDSDLANLEQQVRELFAKLSQAA